MSEIARLKKLIELECEAMQRLMTEYAMTGSHDIINNKYSNLGDAQEQLAAIVGEKEGTKIAIDVYIQVMG